jgi:HK97 family phage major capsid protein
MWKEIKRLNEERADVLARMKAVLVKAETEKRELTGEETAHFDALNADAERLKTQLERCQKVYSLENETRESGSLIGRPDFNGQDGQSELGLNERDLKRYSLLRALQAKVEGRPLDGLEKELSDEIALRSGKKPQGFYFPTDVLFQKRDLTTSTASGAVSKFVDHSNFIGMLRAKSVTSNLGARLITGLVGEASIPKQTGGATAYWIAEGNAPTGTNQTVGQVALAPKTVGAFTDLTRKFIRQTSMDAEFFVREDLATVLSLAIDAAALNGSGTGAEPQGILQNSNVQSVSIGTNGGALTWAKVVEMETKVATANALVGNLAYLLTPAARGSAKVTERATNTGQFIWADDNTINGYAAHSTSLLPSNLTKGSGTALSSAIFGNWSDLIIAMWGGLDINVDPYTLSSSGGVRIVALQEVDVKLRHAESFVKCTDIVTT